MQEIDNFVTTVLDISLALYQTYNFQFGSWVTLKRSSSFERRRKNYTEKMNVELIALTDDPFPLECSPFSDVYSRFVLLMCFTTPAGGFKMPAGARFLVEERLRVKLKLENRRHMWKIDEKRDIQPVKWLILQMYHNSFTKHKSQWNCFFPLFYIILCRKFLSIFVATWSEVIVLRVLLIKCCVLVGLFCPNLWLVVRV